MRRVLGLALAGAAFVGSLALLAMMAQCGMVVREAVAPGAPQAPDRCVGALPPASPLLLLLTGGGALGALRGAAWAPLAAGLVLLTASVPLMLSVGAMLVPLAALLITSGLALARPRRAHPA